jgi:hypothetical protein
MKKTIVALLSCLTLFGCTDNKKQEKALLDSIIAVHDKVMRKDDQLMHNKMKLDTLLKAQLTGVADTAAEKRQLMGLNVQLTQAEDAMETWMQKFDADQKGKSHQEIMDYFSAQKTQVSAVDSSINAAINASTNYLNSLKKP